eukprot:373197-Pyramimonas_sp.AAC.1
MCDRCLSSVISTTPVLVIIGILVLILLAILRICCTERLSAQPTHRRPPRPTWRQLVTARPRLMLVVDRGGAA